MASPKMAPLRPVSKPIAAPAIYARVSTWDQDCAMQLAYLREYCKAHGWPKPVEYVDHAVSGAKASRRELDRFMKAAAAGQHDWVGVWKLDRFARNMLNLKNDLEKLDAAGVRFAATTQNIDTDPAVMNSMGRLMLNLMGTFAEFERDNMMERVAAGRELKVAKGGPDSYNLTYGFQKGKPVVDEKQAGLIRQLYIWRDAEYSVYKLEEMVTAYAAKHGLTPARGKRWGVSTMLKWLRSRQYIGEYERGGRTYELPRIVDQDLWERVQAKMASTRRKTQGNPKHKFTWTGLFYSEHDAPMNGTFDSHGIAYYRCLRSVKRSSAREFVRCSCPYIRASRMESVWAALWALVNDPKMQRAQALALARQEEAGLPQRGKDAKQKLAEAKAMEKRILINFEEGEITNEEKRAKLTALRAKMQDWDAEVRAMGRVVEIAPLSVYEAALAARAQSVEPDEEDRREVLDGLRDLKVQLINGGDEAIVTGNIPISSESAGGSKDDNCSHRLASVYSSSSPFRLQIKLRAA